MRKIHLNRRIQKIPTPTCVQLTPSTYQLSSPLPTGRWMVRSCCVALNPMVENIRTDFKHQKIRKQFSSGRWTGYLPGRGRLKWSKLARPNPLERELGLRHGVGFITRKWQIDWCKGKERNIGSVSQLANERGSRSKEHSHTCNST